MSTTLEAASHHSSRKFSILLPLRAIQNLSFHYETPCKSLSIVFNLLAFRNFKLNPKVTCRCSVGESVSFFSFPKNDDAHLSRGKKLSVMGSHQRQCILKTTVVHKILIIKSCARLFISLQSPCRASEATWNQDNLGKISGYSNDSITVLVF